MEIWAAALSFADHQLRQVIANAREASCRNMLVIDIQRDNSVSGEDGLSGKIDEQNHMDGFPHRLFSFCAAGA